MEIEERRVARSWWELMVEDDDEEWREVGRKREEDRHAREERRKVVGEERGENEGGKKTGRGRKGKEVREVRKKRERNVVWRGVDGENEEERLWLVEEILKRTLRRKVVIRSVRERKEEGGR